MYVVYVGRSTSTITAFRRTSGHTEVRHFCSRMYFISMKKLALFFLSGQSGPKIIHFL